MTPSMGPVASTACDPKPLAGFLSTTCGSFDAGTANVMVVGSGAGVVTGGLGAACPPDESGCSVGTGSSPWGWG